MSQFWHAHWAEDAFKPARLGNWQVPNWHPKFPCGGHCTTTTFLADTSGRLLPDQPRSKRSPWGDFKGTWELPLKIDRKLARILSAPPRYKLAAWETHKARHQTSCGKTSTSPRKMDRKAPPKQANPQKPTKTEKPAAKLQKTAAKSNRIADRNPESSKKQEKKITKKEIMKNEVREENIEDEQMGPEEQRVDSMDREECDVHRQKLDVHGKGRDVYREERDVHKRKIVQEQQMKKLGQEEHNEKKNSRCFCRDLYRTNSLSFMRDAPKAARKNICTVHQRLRV